MTRSDDTREQNQQPQQMASEFKGNPYDPNDLMNYIREPGELPRHMRDPLPSEVAYR